VEHDYRRRWFSKRADVVVTAVDGATGGTVWLSVWPRRQGKVLWSSDVVAKDGLFTLAMPVCEGDKAVFYAATTNQHRSDRVR
jgi:hypothetical protein